MIDILVLVNKGTKNRFVDDQIDDMLEYFDKSAPQKLGVKRREFNITVRNVDVPIKLKTIGTTSQGREAKGADDVKRNLNVEEGKYDAVYFVYDGTPSFSKKGWYNAAFTYNKPLYTGTQMAQVPDTADDETFQHEWMHIEGKLHTENGNMVDDQMDLTNVNGKMIPYYKDNQPTYKGGNFHKTFKSLDKYFTGSFDNKYKSGGNIVTKQDKLAEMQAMLAAIQKQNESSVSINLAPFELAKKEIGVREIVGQKHNPRVLEYFEKSGHSWVKDDETAWCAAFMGWCLESAGIKSTRKLNARSYLEFGTPVTEPKRGDVVIFYRGDKNGWQGHVGFFEAFSADGDILVLGGNQANKVGVQEYSINRLLGYRRVPGVVTPTVVMPKPGTIVPTENLPIVVYKEKTLLNVTNDELLAEVKRRM